MDTGNNSLIPVFESTINTMSSREIAELTGKQHAHVMRDIRAMLEKISTDPNLDWHCETVSYTDEQGKPRDMYRMDKDTTLTLVSGYDHVLRFRIIKRWQELEAAKEPQFKIPKTLSEALQLAADQAKQIEVQNAQIEVMAPKAEYYDQLLGANEVFDGEQTAKILRTSRNSLYTFLKQRGIITKSNLPMQLYVDKDYMRVKQTPYNDVFGNPKLSLKIVFTQNGIKYVRGLLGKILIANDVVAA